MKQEELLKAYIVSDVLIDNEEMKPTEPNEPVCERCGDEEVCQDCSYTDIDNKFHPICHDCGEEDYYE